MAEQKAQTGGTNEMHNMRGINKTQEQWGTKEMHEHEGADRLTEGRGRRNAQGAWDGETHKGEGWQRNTQFMGQTHRGSYRGCANLKQILVKMSYLDHNIFKERTIQF